MPTLQKFAEPMEMESKSMTKSRTDEYQLDLGKIMELTKEKRDIIMQLISSPSTDYENRIIIRNTLISEGIIITRRENSINECLR